MPEGFTQLTAGFTVPAVGSNVTISVVSSTWMASTQVVYIQTAGYYEVQSLPGATSAIVKNLGYTGNAAPTTAIANGQGVSPGGLIGTTGATGLGTLNSIAPTTTLGDIMADNGANSPSASVVRVARGTNGQALVADSAASAGVTYATISPNTTTDNGIPRFDGTTGKPVPLQTSKVIITDDGAIQATGSTVAGNARGQYAVDLQCLRGAATQVASGVKSVICGGNANTASAENASVLGGGGNTASGGWSSICGGNSSTASGTNSSVSGGGSNQATSVNAAVAGGLANAASGNNAFVGGGTANTASGTDSSTLSGNTNVASATNSTALAGANNSATAENSVTVGGQYALANKYGQVAHASGRFAAQGDCQSSELIIRNATTDATPTVLHLDGGTGPLRPTVPANTSWMVHGLLTARRSTGATGVRELKFGIENTAGTTALKGAATVTTIGTDDAGITIAAVAVTADDPNDAVAVTVTGAVGQTIRWGCSLRIMEVAH